MEKIKKQLQIILYVWVWLLSFSAADAITDEYWITTADRGKIEQRYRNLGIYEVAKKTVSRKEEQYGNYTYRVWYPKRLETENRKWPMVFLLNGTTSTCDLDEPIFEHLASWGFIVVGNTDRNTGLGYSAEWGLELMDKLAADRKSVFFQKIDEENLGIGGHSQGGVVAEGLKLGTPYELTWSCYEGGDTPCGECGTCIDRAKAFAENGVEDPWNGGKG